MKLPKKLKKETVTIILYLHEKPHFKPDYLHTLLLFQIYHTVMSVPSVYNTNLLSVQNFFCLTSNDLTLCIALLSHKESNNLTAN